MPVNREILIQAKLVTLSLNLVNKYLIHYQKVLYQLLLSINNIYFLQYDMTFFTDTSNIHELSSPKDFLQSRPVSRWFENWQGRRRLCRGQPSATETPLGNKEFLRSGPRQNLHGQGSTDLVSLVTSSWPWLVECGLILFLALWTYHWINVQESDPHEQLAPHFLSHEPASSTGDHANSSCTSTCSWPVLSELWDLIRAYMSRALAASLWRAYKN